ncbi:alanine--tRNA ligase, partial [Candidatus Micrarchaeota archaeon CG11_big_fil_rev_8_21_14_0_20_47_5]
MPTKDELRQTFSKEWKKHYEINALKEKGFTRQECKKCKRHFWAIQERSTCADSSCTGYEFIGNPPSSQKLDYIDTWKKIEKYFTKHGHTSIEPYPTVARWRDDLYFTIASINDFQPYVVNGEIEPPANPLIVPQPCIRFSDISNVGITGRHYTNFVMVGQHAFNTKKTGMFYWKDEALSHDLGYLKTLGIPEEKLIFLEDVWMGGGNFGPSMEYFVGGLELGNCVFMQYAFRREKQSELSTKVIDMGAGLSRLAWITHGSPTSYEVVFGPVIEQMKKNASLKIDQSLFERYAKYAGIIDAEDATHMAAQKKFISDSMHADFGQVAEKLRPIHSLYACADHLCTFLFTSTDGMLPSNSGGGYNLRMILRRVFAADEEFSFSLDYAKILQGHANYLKPIFPKLQEGVPTAIDVVEEERK